MREFALSRVKTPDSDEKRISVQSRIPSGSVDCASTAHHITPLAANRMMGTGAPHGERRREVAVARGSETGGWIGGTWPEMGLLLSDDFEAVEAAYNGEH